jgi:ABC-2 type transport system ATP-binding protein
MGEEIVLSVKDLKKGFMVKQGHLLNRTTQFFPALNGISFEIKKGEIFGLLGPNGAGKTTTINIIAGILDADGGEIQYFGKPLSTATKKRMNVTTAYTHMHEWLTVYENLTVFAELYEVENPKQRIEELCKMFDMADKIHRKVRDLSAGQKTRVNLMKGLINNPELLLLDEATIGLDPDIAIQVRELIKGLNTTILFTSHNMDEVAQLCDRIAFLSRGKVLLCDTPQALTRVVPDQQVIIEYVKMTPKLKAFIKKMGAEQDESLRLITFTIPHTGKALDALLRSLFAKCEVADVIIEKPHLEDVFIKIAAGGR